MAIQITIIGLGQIGASVGLALGHHQDLITRIGYDRDGEILQHCETIKAIDQATADPQSAVAHSDLVILSLPIDQLQDTMAEIAANLKPHAIVLDTGPVKQAAADWANDTLPEDCDFIGLIPAINPIYLHVPDRGVDTAREDLFAGSLIALVSSPETKSRSLKKAADLVRLLGANPLIIDPYQMDRIMAATHLLPQLMASALLNATAGQPEWQQGRQFAGRSYEQVSSPVAQQDSQAIATAIILNQKNMLKVIDLIIAVLNATRDEIKNAKLSSLDKRLGRAQQERENWWHQRQSAK